MEENQQVESIDHLRPLLLNIGYASHYGDWNWKNVSSPFVRIFYVLEGTAQVHFANETHTLTPGHMYFIPPFVTHSYSCDALFKHIYLHIYDDYGAHYMMLDGYDMPFEVEPHPMDLKLIEHLIEVNPPMQLPHSNPLSYDNKTTLSQCVLRNKHRSIGLRVESRGILFLLLSRFLEKAKKKVEAEDKRIQKAINYIHTHISQPITIEELANQACLSKDHLIRLFKKEAGDSPLQYINHRKIEQAQLMLVTDNISVKRIAYMLGYNDYSYFIRLFKKITGVSPLEYRKNN